ncbi:COX assembly mitochondrial protein [Plasmodiophora brassicae]
MHPVSASDPRSHPACADAIVALATCHKERSIAKFFGACNDFKAALDQCMRSEKKERRERNRREAREFDMNWHALRESMRQKDV